MIRVFVVYDQEPDPGRYEQHAELCRLVPGGVFRHGKVSRTMVGEPLSYYAEWEFPDKEAFKAAAATPEFAATGKDAADMAVPHRVYLAEVE